MSQTSNIDKDIGNGPYRIEHKGWEPGCDCDAGIVSATVLDSFVGSGTTVAVAQSLGRRGIGVDLSAEYLDMAQRRIAAVALPLGV